MANPKSQMDREGSSQGVWSFLDRNWQIVAVILAVVAIFVWYQALNLGTNVQKALDDVSKGIGTTTTPTATTMPATPGAVTTPIVPLPGTPGSQYTQIAAKGQGLTHLARQSLQTYLTNEKPKITLSREQKIYIEDYLKDQKVGSVRHLEEGQQLSFTTDSIKDGIKLAQQLTPGQLQNLTKYANRVSGLSPYAGIQ